MSCCQGERVASVTHDTTGAGRGGRRAPCAVLSLLGGSRDDRDRRRILKSISRRLRRDANNLLSLKADRVLPGLGKLFFALYRTLGPAQELLRSADPSQGLKSIVIETGMSAAARELLDQLQPNALKPRFADKGEELAEQARVDLEALATQFPSERIAAINSSSWSLERLLDLVNFDHYFLLKKLHSQFPDQDYECSPRFQPTGAQHLSDDLQDFLEVLMHFDVAADSSAILDILQQYKGTDVVGQAEFARLLATFGKLKRNRALLLVVQLIQSEPFYQPEVAKPERARQIEDYLGRLKTQVQLTLTQLTREKRSQQMGRLTQALFGDNARARLLHYAEKNNQLFSKRKLLGYTHISELDYLSVFVVDYCKHDVRLMVDLLLIKGQMGGRQPLSLLVRGVLCAGQPGRRD